MSRFPSEGFAQFASLPPAARSGTLLRALADLFALSPEHRRDDIHLFEALFLPNYAEASVADRATVAALLSARPDLPGAVALAIGLDEIDIARAVLADSPVPTPLDLTRIACRTSPAHREIIAGRSDLDAGTIAALLVEAEPAVIERLLANPAASLTDENVERIRSVAAEHPAILNRMVRRIRPPGGEMIDQFFDLDEEARWMMLDAFATEVVVRQIESRGRHEWRPEIPAIDTRLMAAFAARDHVEAAALVAEALDIDLQMARRIIDDAGGEPLMLALSAIGIDADASAGMLILSAEPAGSRSYRRVRDLREQQVSIGRRAAIAVLDRWRGAPAHVVETLRQLDDTERRAPRPAVTTGFRRPAIAPMAETRRA